MRSIKHIITVAGISLMLLTLSLGTGCELIPAPPAPPPGPPSPPADNITAPTNPGWLPPSLTGDNVLLSGFAPLVAKVRPAVVAINTEQGAGSGWVIDKVGYIVTNNHVVHGASTITVTLDDGRSFKARVVGADSLSDIAVLQIDTPGLKDIPIGDNSQDHTGNLVIAIGNPLDLGLSVTSGIISALNVSLPIAPGQTVDDLIQTDAAINAGNSGGPLINMKGEVIGINSIKISQAGYEGMAYAISMRTALPVIQDLIQQGYVTRPFLGVSVRDINQFLMLRFKLPMERGALITQIVQDSPAARAGLETGDIIANLNDTDIISSGQLIQTLQLFDIGSSVIITYYRGNERFTTTAVLVESPPP